MTMRFVMPSLCVAVSAMLAASLPATPLLEFTDPAIRDVFGGVCADCKVDNTGPCVVAAADQCKDLGGGVWKKKTGMLITPIRCFDVPIGAAGATSCTSDRPQVCLKYQTCTGANCTNCGPESTDEKDTRCTLGQYLCKGT